MDEVKQLRTCNHGRFIYLFNNGQTKNTCNECQISTGVKSAIPVKGVMTFGLCEHGYTVIHQVDGNKNFLCQICHNNWNLKRKRLLLVRKR